MFDIGRICIKIAGRDAGKEAVIVDILENGLVLVDGNVRRRSCNPKHLEPTSRTVDIKKAASHEDVKKAFEKAGLPVRQTKPKTTANRPRKARKKKQKPEKKATTPPKKTKGKKKETKEEKPVAKKEASAEDVKKALGGE